ncbi:MAG: hypothetical protein KME12_14490 [Trichocoleus desertorum ATA4-8-CV12]|nr:hypothetical protein [Trichocoleus desertorum ATA4-8-CV12]
MRSPSNLAHHLLLAIAIHLHPSPIFGDRHPSQSTCSLGDRYPTSPIKYFRQSQFNSHSPLLQS